MYYSPFGVPREFLFLIRNDLGIAATPDLSIEEYSVCNSYCDRVFFRNELNAADTSTIINCYFMLNDSNPNTNLEDYSLELPEL